METKKEFTGKYIVGSIIFGLGVAAGMYLGNDYAKPSTAYLKDLNADGKQELVVESKAAEEVLMVQKADGTFENVDSLSKKINDALKQSIDEKLNQPENK